MVGEEGQQMGETAAAPWAVSTAEELLDLPDDGYRYELVRGELRQMTPAGYEHGRIAARVARVLDAFVSEHQLGEVVGAETGFILGRGPDTVRAADGAFVAAERVPADRDGFAELAPDLAVEVVSSGDRAADVADKVLMWLEAGSRLVWVIYPQREVVAVHRPGGEARALGAEDVLDGGAILPGFALPVGDLFA